MHENLAKFIGICPDEPNISMLSELCIRGSLRDMLENEVSKGSVLPNESSDPTQISIIRLSTY